MKVLTLGRLPSRLAWRSWQQCAMLRIAMVPTRSGSDMAVRQRDMQVVQTLALQQSTLACYLPMLGPDVTAVPNTMQPYLAGIWPTVKSRLKLRFRSGTAAVAHRKELVTRHSRRQETASSQCPCCGHGDETHQLLECALSTAPSS